jgi:hypothetical protein
MLGNETFLDTYVPPLFVNCPREGDILENLHVDGKILLS